MEEEKVRKMMMIVMYYMLILSSVCFVHSFPHYYSMLGDLWKNERKVVNVEVKYGNNQEGLDWYVDVSDSYMPHMYSLHLHIV